MFPLLFRVGPIFIAEIIFMIAGAVQLIFNSFIPCYGYTFIELALQLFLIQMVIVFRLIEKNKQLRYLYISKLVFGSNQFCKIRLWLNSFWISIVILGLAFWMAKEGFTLSNSQIKDANNIFTLYPLCFFSDETAHAESSEELRMILNFSYACNVIMNFFLMALSIRSLYLYIQRINRNRKYFIENFIATSESLIDCEIFKISEKLINIQNQDQRDCGICLRKFCREKVIRLRCSHYFHQECIKLWLQKKDECPYRCP